MRRKKSEFNEVQVDYSGSVVFLQRVNVAVHCAIDAANVTS